MPPILTNIETAAQALVAGMTTAGGYSYNWGTVNDPDAALWSYPSAQIVVESEDNLDEPDGPAAGAYYNEVALLIAVVGELSAQQTIPTVSINAVHNLALDDLKRVFGRNPSVSGTADVVLYRGMVRENKRNGDVFVPGLMLTRWVVRYGQDRETPSQVACI